MIQKKETNKTSALSSFMPQILLPDDEIAEDKISINSKQREYFNVVHTWAKDYVKYDKQCWTNPHISFRQWRHRQISLVKVTYNTIWKTLLYHCKDPEKPKVLLLGSSGKAASIIGETTIHFGLANKPGIKLLALNDKYKAALKSKLSEVKFFDNTWTFYCIRWFMDR